MSLGAAGCGHPESRFEYLTGTLFGFRCKKYDADLKMWKCEPLRLWLAPNNDIASMYAIKIM